MGLTFYLYKNYQKTSGWTRQILIQLFRVRTRVRSLLHKVLFFLEGRPVKIRKNQTDSVIFDSVFGANEMKILAPYKKFKPKLIIDAGAYVGFTSIWFARQHPNADIYAIEPEQSNFEVLKENVRPYKNIYTEKKALWPESMPLFVRDTGTGDWGFKIEPDETGAIESVTATTIQEILEKSGQDTIDILKLDVEGAEREIFEHSDAWKDRVNLIIVELHDWFAPGCKEAFDKFKAKGDWCEYVSGAQRILIKKKFCVNRTAF